MPELPEVETLRRNLERTLVGRALAGVRILQPKMFLSPTGWEPAELIGRSIEGLRRRAKFLIVDLSDDAALVFHLRLAGQLVHRDAEGRTLAEGGHPVPAFGTPLPHKSTHITFDLDDGSLLYLTDIRQFGRVWMLPGEAVPALLEGARLGPEPLDDAFTLGELRKRLARRSKTPLKSLLLDQSFIGGVGNIYADEIIFAARLTPATCPGDLAPAQVRRFHDSIRSVLRFAVEDGVAEILNGKANPDRDFPHVHGREGHPCPRCGSTILKFRFAGRGTYTCPKCQRPSPNA